MISTLWPYLALMLLIAGAFPALERRTGWKLFTVLPPIVLVYLSITALAVAGLWVISPEIKQAQGVLVSRGVPALLFLLMVNCDLRAIYRLGPRVLGVFVSTTFSLFVAFLAVFLLFRPWLAGKAWQPLAALSGSWVGGTANQIAVKEAIGMSDALLGMSLLTDALCYSAWVVVLFSIARLAPAFNRWTGAMNSGDVPHIEARASVPLHWDGVLLWLGFALAAALLSRQLADWLPASGVISATTWAILLATGFGLVVAHTPLARFPGASQLSSALLIVVVAVLASQSNFKGIASAPLYLLAGVCILAIHALVLVILAKVFHFDLYLCGIASLAHVGGVAATPVLAASYAKPLVPVGILLALLGYILGTGFGLLMATIMSALALPGP
ncbi:MAG: DUF819 family protein [Thermomonas sp.]|uniref:DUF819 family protein n=1 Tax=Thermomonas sp. TaxID=1971895 RepID=UPI001D5C5301|nr:DUF819 family protein [Thermomonas sp.]MBZ0087476.1 DUF819 family protein [Thermomonas sp.]